jgi:hypothetical protein
MTRTDYLAALEKYLKTLPEADYKEAMDYFTEYFEDAGSENEALVIKELGDPRDAAEEIIRSLSVHSTEEINSDSAAKQPSPNIHPSQYASDTYIFEDYSTVSELHIDMSTKDIQIEPSPDAFFHIKYYNGKSSNQLSSIVRDKKWYITEKGAVYASGLSWIINVMKNGLDHHPVCIQIPSGTLLQSFSCQSSSGDVNISQLQTQEGMIELASGDLSMRHCQLQQTDVTLTSGDIHLAHAKLTDCKITLVSGDLDTHSLEIAGKTSIQTTSGDVTLHLLHHDFSYDIETVHGDISISEQLQPSHQIVGNTIRHKVSTSTDSLAIQAVSGDINLY